MRKAFPLITVVATALTASAQSPVVRAHIEPAKGILVGQPVRLVVSVYAPNYFTGSPEFPEFEIDNAIVILPQETAQNSSANMGGITYAGITESYTIYPEQPGEFQIPQVSVTVPYANVPPNSTVARAVFPALAFHAEIPGAARGLDYFLPTSRLTMAQKWSAPLKNLRAGDTVERTITITAAMTQAMLIPPLPFAVPDGIRVYPEEPTVQDQKTERGVFVSGRRTQSAKYFIQKPGDYTLPAIELKWWNLSTKRVESAMLPAVHFIGVANTTDIAELPPEPEAATVVTQKHVSFWARYKNWVRLVIPSCIALLLLFWMGWRYTPRLYHRVHAWRMARKHTEAAYFRSLQQVCRREQAKDAYQRLLKWIAVAYSGMTVDEFMSRAGDPVLSSEIECLGASLFATDNQNAKKRWSGRKMAASLTQHRKLAYAARKNDPLKLNP